MPNRGATQRDAVADLLAHDRAVLVAPAGCGKTHLIADALLRLESGRHLVLTHTHAGVGALKARLLRARVPPQRFRVDTIAAWSLRLSASYPKLSGLGTPTPSGVQWNQTYIAAERMLQTRIGRTVVEASYASVFVDEYQDCIDEQHQLVLSLANLMPCRIVGDPLQGIFSFGRNTVVSWPTDVFPHFTQIPDLAYPWRWHGRNVALGDWLLQIRPLLEAGRPVDLSSSPVVWRRSSASEPRTACFAAARNAGSVVAIRQWARDCHTLSSQLGGTFTSMEEMDCKDLMTMARNLDGATGADLIRAVVDAASTCMTTVTSSLSGVHRALASGRSLTTVRQQGWREVIDELIRVEATSELAAVVGAVRAMARQPGVVVNRRELLGELHRMFAAFMRGGFETLEQAAWTVRNQTRLAGRAVERRTVSRTLLVKGLEFEHVVVGAADELDVKNLYVALTRGSTSVTVVSQSPILSPAQ